jgi:hypothetical protein
VASPVALVLSVTGAALEEAVAQLFPDIVRKSLAREELRPRAPFRGALFDILAAVPHGSCVGLVVPMRRAAAASGSVAGRQPPPGALITVADHVNLELRGPLTGRWPAGVPRDFPQVAGIYQPAVVRASGGPRVYSSGVVVAGVADARRLTPFETQAVAELGVIAVSDVLVPAAIVAAYYGLTLAACGVLPADDNDEQ